ncbi:MAG: hypothetical protein U9P44_01020 [archaeon]|nr:hypothetical protein [archaeon]
MFLKKSKKLRKGFMHSVEALFALMILLTYSAKVIDMGVADTGWERAKLSQESREIVNIMDYLEYTDLLAENSYDTFLSIASYFTDREKIGVAISTHDLMVPLLRVGVLTEDEEIYLRYSTNISQNIFGTDEIIVMNGRETRIEVRNTTWDTTLDGGWKNFDVLVIPIEGSYDDMVGNITDMNSTYARISSFLLQGKGIVQVSNLNSASFVDFNVQRDVFGLLWNDTSSLPSSEASSFSEINPSASAYLLHKYYYVMPFKLNTESSVALNVSEGSWWDMDTGIVDVYLGNTNYTVGYANCTVNSGGVPCEDDSRSTLNFSGTINSTNGVYHFKIMSLKHEHYGVILVNSTGLGYDVAYIDGNQDYNFTNDGVLCGVLQNDMITLGDNNYTVTVIDPRGNYIEFKVEKPHNFATLNRDNKIYSLHGFDSQFENKSCFVPVEMDFLASYGAKLPVSVVNYGKFTGRTAWITGNVVSRDEWHFLRSMIFWVSKKEHVISSVTSGVDDIVVTELVLFANKNMSQPYRMEWMAWNYE